MGANAQTSVWTFTAGQVLTAAQMNDTARTGVPVFATTTTRDAAFGGTGEKTLAEGQMCYIEAAPKRLQVYDGTTWQDFDAVSTAYTPTLTNVTLGNGTVAGAYQRVGRYCVVGVHLGFGSTTSVSGLIGIGLPFTASTGLTTRSIPNFALGDTGVTTYLSAGIVAESYTKVDLYVVNAAGTYANIGTGTSATVPHTWGNTDEIYGTVIYRIA